MKCSLYVGGVQGRGLDEAEVVLLSKRLRLIGGHSSQVAEIRLVPNLKTPNAKHVDDKNAA